MFDILRKAIETYGKDAQMDMMIEEMSELTKALLKYRRAGADESAKKKAEENILEEIADVHIVLEQMEMIFDKGNDVFNIVAQKIERLDKRIKEQNNA